jgi:hypothetical protein
LRRPDPEGFSHDAIKEYDKGIKKSNKGIEEYNEAIVPES